MEGDYRRLRNRYVPLVPASPPRVHHVEGGRHPADRQSGSYRPAEGREVSEDSGCDRTCVESRAPSLAVEELESLVASERLAVAEQRAALERRAGLLARAEAELEKERASAARRPGVSWQEFQTMSYPSAPYPEYPAKPPYSEYQASPPPMGFCPPQQAPPVYVVSSAPAMQQPVAIVFGPGSLSMTCPHCNCAISTETQSSHKTCTHICCLLLFCSLGCTLFSCLPYFFCDPGTVEHFCPNCKAKLGTYHS